MDGKTVKSTGVNRNTSITNIAGICVRTDTVYQYAKFRSASKLHKEK